MTSSAVLLALVSTAAVCASLALLAAHLALGRVADALALAAAICGAGAFVSTTVFTLRRARELGKGVRR
jgi:hypothetical protein